MREIKQGRQPGLMVGFSTVRYMWWFRFKYLFLYMAGKDKIMVMMFFLKMQAWVNEKFAPELLESKADLVECMLDQIKEMASSNYYCAQKELF